MNRLAILLIGSGDRPEFAPAAADLAELGELSSVPDIPAAIEHLHAVGPAADIIVLFQAHPGQFMEQQLDALRRLAPLARVVVVAGSWCEGEMRSGKPLSGTIRVYWHQWPSRGRSELARLARGDLAAWALPMTATDEDRLLVDATAVERRSGLVVVYAREKPLADWLVAACRQRGYATVLIASAAHARIEGAVAALFDAGQLHDSEAEELHQFASTVHPAPVVALLEFPRFEDHRRALALGASAVLSKPLLVDDLYRQLDELGHHGRPRHPASSPRQSRGLQGAGG